METMEINVFWSSPVRMLKSKNFEMEEILHMWIFARAYRLKWNFFGIKYPSCLISKFYCLSICVGHKILLLLLLNIIFQLSEFFNINKKCHPNQLDVLKIQIQIVALIQRINWYEYQLSTSMQLTCVWIRERYSSAQ